MIITFEKIFISRLILFLETENTFIFITFINFCVIICTLFEGIPVYPRADCLRLDAQLCGNVFGVRMVDSKANPPTKKG